MRFSLFACCLAASSVTIGQESPTSKKVIEWGWDEPDTKFIKDNIEKMEQYPFDGLVFHVISSTGGNLVWEMWGSRKFDLSEFQHSIDNLKATRFRRFTDRFLRVNVTPGKVDWFDDEAWEVVLNNFAVAAQIAKESGCKGFMFDVEQYNDALFNYGRQTHGDARRTFGEYQAKVRQRGQEWMKEVNQPFPDITVMLTFGYRIAQPSEGKDRSTSNYCLLADFLDGMLDGCSDETKIVDAWEYSYPYKQEKQFRDGYETVKVKSLKWAARPDKYRRHVRAGFGLWMDCRWREVGWNLEEFSKNHFAPDEFEKAVRSALKTSDEYVWIYTEQPHWWTNQRLPSEYVKAVERAREESANAEEPQPAGAVRSVSERFRSRTFPSVFQAWSGADNLPDEPEYETVARHDLIWHGPQFFGLEWNNRYHGLADGFTPESIQRARAFRQMLLKRNPNMILIAEVRYRDAHRSYLPDSNEWWLRDERDRVVPGWDEGRYLCLDFHNPEFRDHVAQQARAVVASGAVDGVMLDWWSDDASRLALIQQVRQAVGEEAIIIANANDRKTPQTAPYINGYFMECYRTATAEDWRRIGDTLSWAEDNLRLPRANCVETWYHESRGDMHLMRAATTLALTHSDGYCLFSDPNPLPTGDHRHNWYPFWNKSLGRSVGKGQKRPDGTWRREFENGTVVYNPMGNERTSLTFPEPRRSLAAGKVANEHQLDSPDGDIFVKTE